MIISKIYKFYDGTSMEWLDKESLKYTENDHVAYIWVDYGSGIFKVNRVLKTEFLNEWKVHPQNSTNYIDENKKKEIILKVQLYYALHNVKCEVE